MDLKIPKVIKKLKLAEYAEEFGEATLEVWVNPPSRIPLQLTKAVDQMRSLVAGLDMTKDFSDEEKSKNEARSEAYLADEIGAMSELLSQGAEETRMSAKSLKAMVKETFETDPMFWNWLWNKALAMIIDHRRIAKKG
jgi:hypothetical protein